MWSWNRNIDTDNLFEKVFENVKYFKRIFKYKYFSFLKVKYKSLKKEFKYFQIQINPQGLVHSISS